MKLFDSSYSQLPDLHDKYKLLNSYDGMFFREIIEQWAEGFQDRDGKILQEFQTSFHSTFWEFYIFQLLKDMGLKDNIDFSKNRPDFIVKDGNKDKFYIEAVVANIKQDGRKENERTSNDLEQTERPVWKLPNYEQIINEGIIRCSNAVQSKNKKYEDYKKLEWVDENIPYIVAVSSYGQINYGNECHYSIMALLYGADIGSNGINYIKVSSVPKNDTSFIDLNIFSKKEYENISAVLFSSKVTLGKVTALALSKGMLNPTNPLILNVYQDDEPPYFKVASIPENTNENLTDGLFLLHNPNAKNKLDLNIFREHGIVQVFENEKGELVLEKINNEGNGTGPLICKVNRAALNLEPIKSIYMEKLFIDFNL